MRFAHWMPFLVGIVLLLLAVARASDLWQEIPGIFSPILAVLLGAWWYARGRVFSRTLTTICAVWLIAEAYYLYGQAGPGLAVVGALCWFSSCRDWQTADLQIRRVLRLLLVVGGIFGVLLALGVLTLDGGQRYDILIGALAACGVARAIILGATNGALSGSVFLIALLGYLVAGQVQAHEYYYYFFGPPQYLVHPTFGPTGVWMMGLAALALLGFSRKLGWIFALGALILCGLAVYVAPPQFASRLDWITSLASPIVLTGIGLLVGVTFHLRYSASKDPPLPDRPWERLIIWIGRGTILSVLGIIIVALTQSISQVRAGPKLKIDPGVACLVPKMAIIQAVIAEDLLYFKHRGVDFARMKWILRDLVRTGELARGASTISMQLAKLEYQDDERTLLRKLRQIFLSIYIESNNSKGDILRRYFEFVPFAPGVRGFCAAAQHFYAQPAVSLTPEQTLALVLTIQDPGAWNPGVESVDRAVDRAMRKRARVVSSRVRSYGKRYKPWVSQIEWAS